MADYPNNQKIPVATLIEKESANGNRYFIGPYGNAKAVLFRDRRDAPDGSPVWTLYVQDSGREPWHPAGPDDGSGRNDAREGGESRQDAPAASAEPMAANTGHVGQRGSYGGHSGRPRPTGDAAKRVALHAQAPRGRD